MLGRFPLFITVLKFITMLCGSLVVVKSFRVASFSRYLSGAKRATHAAGTSASAVMSPVRVRFAPSPTGSLHVGGARTALYNWLLARKTNGTFIIRVEDTDEARSTRESEASILQDLKWLNLNWDEGPGIEGPHSPYRQSERKHIYAQAAEQLIKEGKAYRCFCTEEEMEAQRESAEKANRAGADGLEVAEATRYYNTWRDADPQEVQARLDRGDPFTVRFKVPQGKTVQILDKVRGLVSWDTDAALLGDFVILRSSGMPVYNFCVSVDDAEMEITHVVRAEEHLSNTLRQMLILEALHAKPPTYAHCSLILAPDRSKLSKRHGATSVCQFSEQGFVPEAMVNYLAMLGWNDGTDKDIFTLDELCQAFDLSRIIKSSAVFDIEKLRWLNAQHLRQRSPAALRPVVQEHLSAGPEPILSPTATTTATATATTATSSGVDQQQQFDRFMDLATKIAQRDMELLVDINRLVRACLIYDLDTTLTSDPHAEEVLADASFPAVLRALLDDYHSGTLPRGGEGDSADFAERWKVYMKSLGKRLSLKGKSLFHPVRLCLTGRVSGPDVGDQLQLLHYSQGLLAAGGMGRKDTTQCTSLAQRMQLLEDFSVEQALAKVRSVKPTSTEATAIAL